MKINLKSLPFIISFLSVVILAIYLRHSLYLDAQKFSQEFSAQNASELSSGDIYKISTKLNRLYSLGNWSCIVGEIGGHEFFVVNKEDCRSGFLTQNLIIQNPEVKLVLNLTLHLSDEKIKIFLIILFFQLCTVLSVRYLVVLVEQKKQEDLRAFNGKAMRFSHDVRSPIAAITTLIKSEEVMASPEIKKIIYESLNLINKSSNELLSSQKNELAAPVDVHVCIEQVLMSKKIEYPKLKIELSGGLGIKCVIVESNLKRIISNLINNSVEACLQQVPEVKISMIKQSKNLLIEISDNGKGIPIHIQKNLGQQKISTKELGNGIGLRSAFDEINSWGGSLEVVSSSALGTTLLITIPIIEEVTKIILVDDDELTRMIWENKAKKQKIDLTCFKDVDQFMEQVKNIEHSTTIYLDNNIGESSGLKLAEKLHSLGYKNLYMATGNQPEEFANFGFLKGVIGKEPPF